MPIIKLETTVNAPIILVFNLARSVDLHMHSLAHTNEKAIAGRTTGLVNAGETITWEARHLGITQQLTSLITTVESPHYFADEMVRGAFKSFVHEHHFKDMGNGQILMSDVFNYKSPLGILGKLIDYLFLKRYMTRLLTQRNAALKKTAEDGSWKQLPEMGSYI